MSRRFAIVLITLIVPNSHAVLAQPPKHPLAEKALARLVLKQDYGDELKLRSREVVTTAKNKGVPGLNGLMFASWKGEAAGTEILASVQWFEKKANLIEFYTKTKKRADYKLTEFNGTTLWRIGNAGYSWTDGEHFLISLGGNPDPPPAMVKDWLDLIPSKVAEVEEETRKSAGTQADRRLGEGYSQRGESIYFNGQRIDQAGSRDIDDFAKAVGHKLKLCTDVDADSFEVLSREYTRDRNKVYYKWISPGSRFWVVELPDADPKTFEAIAFELARDKNHVWIRDSIVKGADSKRVKSFFAYRIWADTTNIWNGERRIEGADAETFERIGTSEFGYYRDSKRVYSYFGRLKVVERADPRTFKAPSKR